MRTYSHVGDGVFQEVLDKLELWDEAMQETAQDVEKELNLHDVVSEEQKKQNTVLTCLLPYANI